MSWFYKPYVSAAQRRAQSGREMARLAKQGISVSPVVIEGKKIASTFWGKAWCTHLESYSDYSNRLPRGRTYVRNGSVIDLQIARGKITARVQGSSMYRIEIEIKQLAPDFWKAFQKQCAGKIDSLMELLQGRLSNSVMEVVTHRETGLFPKPAEISMECSCPDWAGMCKHLAAVLYGIGARLDQKPELLFTLRGVDPAELISEMSASEAIAPGGAADEMSSSELSEIFGIELEPASPGPAAKPASPKTARKSRAKKKPAKRSKRRSA